jgi:hypothetical protein
MFIGFITVFVKIRLRTVQKPTNKLAIIAAVERQEPRASQYHRARFGPIQAVLEIRVEVPSQNCEKRDISLVVSVFLSVHSSICKKLAPTRRILVKFDILNIFRKSMEKIQISLKSDKNYDFFTLRPKYIYDNLSLNSSGNGKYFSYTLYRKSSTHFTFSNFPSKIVSFKR